MEVTFFVRQGGSTYTVKLWDSLGSFYITLSLKRKIGRSLHHTSMRIWVQILKRFFVWEKIERVKALYEEKTKKLRRIIGRIQLVAHGVQGQRATQIIYHL